MFHSTKSSRQKTRFTGVFQFHDNQDKDVDEARSYIIDVITKCLLSRQPIPKPDFNLTLYYGSYGGRRWTKDLTSSLRALVWKYSELTGKYCGCQYWSVKAKELFEGEMSKLMLGDDATLHDAWELTNGLAKKDKPKDERLVHEHVFPINHLLQELQRYDRHPTTEWVRRIIEERACGCVVLEGEHCLLPNFVGDCSNPWLRYKGHIGLVDNKNWSPSHRDFIVDAGLL